MSAESLPARDAGRAGCGITFPAGLVGLPEMKCFRLVDEERWPWMRLESVDERRLAFTVVDARQIRPSYAPPLDPQVLASTGSSSTSELNLFVLAVEGPAGPETVNLLAPLVVNVATGLGSQVVLDPAQYPLRHPVGS